MSCMLCMGLDVPSAAPCDGVAGGQEDIATAEEEPAELWQPDWDDEDPKEDFLARLQAELGRNEMKD